jgi:hypothetical protein
MFTGDLRFAVWLGHVTMPTRQSEAERVSV